MNRFDDELKRAFSREEPSPDFTDRVMARVAELQKREKPKEKTGWLRRLAEFFQPPQDEMGNGRRNGRSADHRRLRRPQPPRK